jgi:hypothetical protein
MQQVEEDAGGEGDGIKAGIIVDRTGELAAKCQALPALRQQQTRCNHQRPENHRRPHAKLLGGLPIAMPPTGAPSQASE